MRWLRGSLLLVLVLLFPLQGNAHASEPKRHHNQSQEKAASHTNNAQDKDAVATYYPRLFHALRLIAEESAAQRQQEHADHQDWYSSPFWVSVFLAIVGALYTVFAAMQWRAISTQANIAERTLTLQMRPWLNIPHEKCSFVTAPTADTPIVVEFVIDNFGHSPAWITRFFARIQTIEAGKNFPIRLDYATTSLEETYFASERGRLILPNDGRSVKCMMFGRQFGDDEIRKWKQGEFHVYMYGFVEYKGADSLWKPRRLPFIAKHHFQDITDARKVLLPEMLVNAGMARNDRWEVELGPETEVS